MQICNEIIFSANVRNIRKQCKSLTFICRSWCMQLKRHLKIYNNKIIIRDLLLVLSINLKSNKININKDKQGKFLILPIDCAIVLNSKNGGNLVLKSANKGPSPLHKMIMLTQERYRTAKRSLRSKTIGEWNKLNIFVWNHYKNIE